MSNKHLPEATHAKYAGPFYPKGLSMVQKNYSSRLRRLISVDEIEHFASLLGPMFGSTVKFEENFTTEDGTAWYAVRFQSGTGVTYKIAFPKGEDPKHKDGTLSSQHVALYYFFDSEVTDFDIEMVSQLIATFFHTAR